MDSNRRHGHLDLDRADAYGRSFADVYDRWYHQVSDAEATAAFVADRCNGPVLELGVGSGRLARPLVGRGLSVVGLDGSADMLARCRAADNTGITLVRADMRALPFRGRFGAVLIAFNTVFNLTTEADQQRLFDELADLVDEDGSVIVEALDMTALLTGPARSIGPREVLTDGAVITATQMDQSTQVVSGQHLEVDDRGVSVRPWRLRWLTPGQLDEMAGRAGLQLTERFRSWDEDRFGPDAETHVSVYRSQRRA